MTTDEEEMTCRELVDVITDYLEEALSEADRARFDAHIAECAYCRSYLDQMRETISAIGTLSEESLSSPARDQLLAAFRDWRAGG